MLYCPACKIVHEEGKCPRCGRDRSRAVQMEDACEVLSVAEPLASMAEDLLKQAGIPVMKEGELGGFFTATMGTYGRGPVSLLVPFAALEDAREALAAAFSELAEEAPEAPQE